MEKEVREYVSVPDALLGKCDTIDLSGLEVNWDLLIAVIDANEQIKRCNAQLEAIDRL